jgi:hypothetical protein
MPVLKNARHELFCQNLAKGMTQERAYVGAGYRETPESRTYASRLAAKDNIRQRVGELQSRNVEIQDGIGAVTTKQLLAMAEEARTKAMSERGGSAAAIAAITAIGKLAGG